MSSAKLTSLIENDSKYLFQNYGKKQQVCFVRGDGTSLYDQDGREYIDFFSGIAVCNLGYNNRAYVKALHEQIDRIVHTSNHFYNREQIEAARLLSELAFPGKTLFVNSGAEANEAAIKLARKYGLAKSASRYHIVTLENSFHGRTFGSMSATGQKKIHDGFGPIVEGFSYVRMNDIDALKKVLSGGDTAAFMMELVQGEGGIRTADPGYVRQAASLCREKDILFIVDEVQSGIGRTGKPFGFQNYGITPDIIVMAKGLAGGVPIGAIHARADLADYLPKGTHGSTFGGNHLATAAAAAVLKELKKKSLLDNVNKAGTLIMSSLVKMQKKVPMIREVRGLGLLIGIELDRPGAALVEKALGRGLVINCTSEKVIRIMPPLSIKTAAIKKGLAILEDILIEEEGNHGNSKN